MLGITAGSLVSSTTCSIHNQWWLNLVGTGTNGVPGKQLQLILCQVERWGILAGISHHHQETWQVYKGVQVFCCKMRVRYTCQKRLQFHLWLLWTLIEHTLYQYRTVISLLQTESIISICELDCSPETWVNWPGNIAPFFCGLMTMFSCPGVTV